MTIDGNERRNVNEREIIFVEEPNVDTMEPIALIKAAWFHQNADYRQSIEEKPFNTGDYIQLDWLCYDLRYLEIYLSFPSHD